MTEASPEDLAEQRATPSRDSAADRGLAVPAEADPADAAEQAATTSPGEHDAPRDLPLEADAADAAEQAVVVELDDDEPR